MQLIVNADDFGLSRGVNLGILEGFQHGIVRSTTMMTTMPAFADAVTLAEESPELGIGVHLTLTAGKPITESSVLMDDSGYFFRSQEMIAELPSEAIEKEFSEQVKRFLASGLKPTHLDSHHHVHKLSNVFAAFVNVADRYDLPARLFEKRPKGVISTEQFDGTYYYRSKQDNMGVSRIKQILGKHQSASSLELMVHPALIDQDLIDCTSYLLPRVKELDTLCDPELRAWIEQQGITLSHFGQI